MSVIVEIRQYLASSTLTQASISSMFVYKSTPVLDLVDVEVEDDVKHTASISMSRLG